MGKVLNFNKIKKTYLTVTLADENNTTVMIGTPTKAMMDDLVNLQDTLSGLSEDTSMEATDELYSMCAKLMSRNKNGIAIEKDFLANVFDVEDIVIFFNAYMDFVTEISSAKN